MMDLLFCWTLVLGLLSFVAVFVLEAVDSFLHSNRSN